MTDTQAGLLPCPFCGGHDTGVCENSQTGKFTPVCASCGAGLVPYDTQEKAIEAWNDRPSPPASSEVVERVAREIYDLFHYDGVGEKPKWSPSGNSLKQDEAREIAKRIIQLVPPPPPGRLRTRYRGYL